MEMTPLLVSLCPTCLETRPDRPWSQIPEDLHRRATRAAVTFLPKPPAAGTPAPAGPSEREDTILGGNLMMALPTRPLGRSGLHITRVGLGSWAVGGGGWSFGWGPQDDAASLATMQHALERGVNWIDTAAVYGLGHSEELVGHLIRRLPTRLRPLVFTKCGLRWDEHDPMAPPRQVLTPDSIRTEGEASLRRLGVERID